jgi:hypothetical protein
MEERMMLKTNLIYICNDIDWIHLVQWRYVVNSTMKSSGSIKYGEFQKYLSYY